MLSTSRAALMTMTSTGGALGPQPPQHLQAGHVGQVDVEQHQVGAQPADRPRAPARRCDAVPTTWKPSRAATKPACTFATMKSSSTIRTPITTSTSAGLGGQAWR